MADNYYAAGLELLLRQDFFVNAERAFLGWLLSAARESAAVYWDQVNGIQPDSDLDRVRENVKFKCRHFMLHDQFAQLKERYNRSPNAQAA